MTLYIYTYFTPFSFSALLWIFTLTKIHPQTLKVVQWHTFSPLMKLNVLRPRRDLRGESVLRSVSGTETQRVD